MGAAVEGRERVEVTHEEQRAIAVPIDQSAELAKVVHLFRIAQRRHRCHNVRDIVHHGNNCAVTLARLLKNMKRLMGHDCAVAAHVHVRKAPARSDVIVSWMLCAAFGTPSARLHDAEDIDEAREARHKVGQVARHAIADGIIFARLIGKSTVHDIV